jgi:6-pyruvoyltetrahydropterin/6-carboxytetrahydropterin synthase
MMETFGIRIYKEYFNFAAAHFLIFEDGTREELHGHNYRVQMQIEGTLDETQDVFIDFLHIKPIVKSVCDRIDHRTLLPANNPFLRIALDNQQIHALFHTGDQWAFPERDVIILPILNTSSERLAQYLCHETIEKLSEKYPEAMIGKIEFNVEESPGQAAIYRLQYPELRPLRTLEQTELTSASVPVPN